MMKVELVGWRNFAVDVQGEESGGKGRVSGLVPSTFISGVGAGSYSFFASHVLACRSQGHFERSR